MRRKERRKERDEEVKEREEEGKKEERDGLGILRHSPVSIFNP